MPRLRPPPPVEAGQRYRPSGGGAGTWIVVGFSEDHAGNPHARLEMAGDRTRVITIALSALRDRRLYQRVTDRTEHDDVASSQWIGFERPQPGEPA